MDLNISQENMHELIAKLKDKFTQLTEDDLFSSKGNQDDIIRMIEYKLGKTKEEMKEIIAEL